MQVKQGFWLPFITLLALGASSISPAAIPDIYPEPGQATADLAAALRSAAATHRRVIVDFGGNWCPDCHVLDAYFHDAVNQPILDAHFVIIRVNVGMFDQNIDIADRYKVPIKKGVPALAVLDARGKVLYSQESGEFKSMRHMQSTDVTQFLQLWAGPGS